MTEFMYLVPLPPAELAKRLTGPHCDELFSYLPLTLHQAVQRNFKRTCPDVLQLHSPRDIAIENVSGVGSFFPRLLSRLTKLGLPVGGTVSVALTFDQLLGTAGARIPWWT